jgi:hypothetical protein
MIGRRLSRWVTGLVVLASALAAGCTTGFIQDAARTSLASFVNGVVSTAVNQTLGP